MILRNSTMQGVVPYLLRVLQQVCYGCRNKSVTSAVPYLLRVAYQSLYGCRILYRRSYR